MGVYLGEQYMEVEWIQSSGTQCINTNYAENKNFRIEMDIQFTSTSPTQQRLFGHSSGTDIDSGCVSLAVYINGSRQWSRYVSDGGGSPQSTNISADTNRHLFVLDNSRLVIYTNGTSIYNGTNSTTVTRTNTRNLYLLCDYDIANNIINNFAKAKLYSCKIYDNDVLVRDFIPCYRKSDNEIGLFDKVENKFYANAGTGTFTKGNDLKVVLPELKNVYIGEVGEYTISNIPTTDTNVYVNVARSGKTIQSITFKFYYIYANAKGAYIHISGNNSNASRYGMVVAPYGVSDGTVGLRIRGRLNSGVETIFRTITNGFNSQGNNNIEYTINRNGSCTVNCNGTTTNYTATGTELTDIQTIMNLSNMNVYASQTAAVLDGNKVDVSVTYS